MKTIESINKEISETVAKLNALRQEKENIIKNLIAELNCFKFKEGDYALYKGVPYKIQYIGKTKFGYRARLKGSIDDFWVDVSDLSSVIAKSNHSASLKKETKIFKKDDPRLYDAWKDDIDEYLDIYDDDGLIPF